MFELRLKRLIFLICNLVPLSRGLEKSNIVEDNTILATESIIRNTTNELFLTLCEEGAHKTSTKIKQLSTIHDYLISVTRRDHKTLNTILRLSRVNNNKYNNETNYFMPIINGILNEDTNVNEEPDSISNNEDLLQHVYAFLTNLERFKDKVGNEIEYQKLNVNDVILKILQDKNSPDNVNATRHNEVQTDEDLVLGGNEFWEPDQPTRRIYKGKQTKVKHFPFMASIQIFDSFQCAGSIIKSDLILTASSCLQLAWNNRLYRENPAFLSVRVGSNYYNGGGESIPALEIYFHPEYNPKNLRNNLCVLRLIRKLKFRKNKRRLKKIDIDRFDSQLPMTTGGITIVGWGAKGTSNIVGNPYTNQLAFAVLDVYHLQECQEIYSREYVTRSNFCAGFISKGGGACNRDVGGPGVVNGYLTGVVSFGSPVCGTPDAPTVFTKVGYYADWIEEIMEQEVPYIKMRTTARPERLPRTWTPLLHNPPTTFKMAPLSGGRLKPHPINHPDALRILEDEELFKEFLATMFESQEANDYKDLLNVPANSKSQKEGFHDPHLLLKAGNESLTDIDSLLSGEQDIHDIMKGSNFITILNGYESATEVIPKYAGELESNLMKLIDNIPLEGSEEPTISNEVSEKILQMNNNLNKSPHKDETHSHDTHRMDTKKNNERHKTANKAVKKKDNEVLTLLYLSDNEKEPHIKNIGGIIEDFDESLSGGLSIPIDGFKDLTFRNNKTKSLTDFMSKDEIYDLLNEAFDDVYRNKTLP